LRDPIMVLTGRPGVPRRAPSGSANHPDSQETR
jgi:hypothetical protein